LDDTSLRDLRDNWRPVLSLVLVAVGLTTIAVAFAAHLLVPGLPWAAAIALGALLSPPDAVAALAILRRVDLRGVDPRRAARPVRRRHAGRVWLDDGASDVAPDVGASPGRVVCHLGIGDGRAEHPRVHADRAADTADPCTRWALRPRSWPS
jgi:hypothetical protein